MSSKELKNNVNKNINKFFNKLYINFPNLKTIKKLDSLIKNNALTKYKPIKYIYIDKDSNKWFTKTDNKFQEIFLFGKVIEENPQPTLLILTFDKQIEYTKKCSGVIIENQVYITEEFLKDINPNFKTLFNIEILNFNEPLKAINLGNYEENTSNFLNNIDKLLEEIKINETQEKQLKHCEICGKQLKKQKNQLCQKCLKKRHAANLLIDLLKHVEPETPFTKKDLIKIYKDKIKVNNCIWSLQDFNLIKKENNEFLLKNESVLNEFIEKYSVLNLKEELKNTKEKPKKLNKTCSICNKTLPQSKFYKNKLNEDGLEDYCKKCKNNVNAANYLKELLKQVNFASSFKITDLDNSYQNPIELTGRLWELLDYDLLAYDENSNIYTLADEKTCTEFLDKYYNSKTTTEKSKIKEKTQNEILTKTQQMDIIIENIKIGKSEKESAELANINLYNITYWYNEGKNNSGEDNINFYKRFNKAKKEAEINSMKNFYVLESFANKDELSLADSLRKQQMENVLKEIGSGNSLKLAASHSNITYETIHYWYNRGKQNFGEEYVEFYEKINILQSPIELSKPKEPEKFTSNNKNDSLKFSSSLSPGEKQNKNQLRKNKIENDISCAYFKNNNGITAIISGTIHQNELIKTINYFKFCEKNIIRVITHKNINTIELFIEFNFKKNELSKFKEKIENLKLNTLKEYSSKINNKKTKYTENKLIKDKPEKIANMYLQITKRIKQEFNGIKIKPSKLYSSFIINDKYIASVSPFTQFIKTWINTEELDDYMNKTRDVTNIGHWGVGNFEYTINTPEDIDYFMELFKQAYEEKL